MNKMELEKETVRKTRGSGRSTSSTALYLTPATVTSTSLAHPPLSTSSRHNSISHRIHTATDCDPSILG
ncbi:hypothetical protein BDN70DRAFT_884897 [Pholiota conissans]|uniref:Uncharacterized protein n=1 Tax=Pholiota conissans TaxID=109636 RepID=A0A9P5YRZ5_9AGAR|nr:hypothetical protein BDN70DRAFT_884897 [Pholiota conissans]